MARAIRAASVASLVMMFFTTILLSIRLMENIGHFCPASNQENVKAQMQAGRIGDMRVRTRRTLQDPGMRLERRHHCRYDSGNARSFGLFEK
jgi:hypothetical protein